MHQLETVMKSIPEEFTKISKILLYFCSFLKIGCIKLHLLKLSKNWLMKMQWKGWQWSHKTPQTPGTPPQSVIYDILSSLDKWQLRMFISFTIHGCNRNIVYLLEPYLNPLRYWKLEYKRIKMIMQQLYSESLDNNVIKFFWFNKIGNFKNIDRSDGQANCSWQGKAEKIGNWMFAQWF